MPARKERIPPATVVFGSEFAQRPHLILVFAATRDGEPLLTPADGRVDVIVQLGTQRVNVRFNLKDMIVDGVLMI